MKTSCWAPGNEIREFQMRPQNSEFSVHVIRRGTRMDSRDRYRLATPPLFSLRWLRQVSSPLWCSIFILNCYDFWPRHILPLGETGGKLGSLSTSSINVSNTTLEVTPSSSSSSSSPLAAAAAAVAALTPATEPLPAPGFEPN